MKKIARKLLWKFRLELSLIFLSITTIVAFIPVFTYLYFASDLRSKETIMNRNETGVTLLDKNDKPFFTFYEAYKKEFVPLSKIPKITQQAVIAAEDKEFYSHPGFSIRGIIRSVFLDIRHGEPAYGGSTITQQLVKNVLLTSKRNFLRKYQELVLAQEIERRFSKNEILEMYLNSVYFGEGAFGIEGAAKKYFGKHASQLTLAESSLLAGILPAPSQYSPLNGSSTEARVRQQYVLASMQELGYISSDEKKKAETVKLTYSSVTDTINSTGAHFAILVRDALVEKYGEERISRSGFKVKTTLDLSWQAYAEKVVADQVAILKQNNVSNGSAVVLDPHSGEVRVLVGSKDWFDGKFGKVNIATSSRSPGSAFKPIIYAAALEKRIITPATSLRDEPTTFPGSYKPLNYDRQFRGRVLARRALANSLNVPAVEVMQKVGVEEGLAIGERLGLTTLREPSNYGLSLVLGTAEVKLLELTNVYATFANGGEKYAITTISSITDKNGKMIYEYKPDPQRVLESGVAFLISSILSDNHARSEMFGNALTVSRPAAVKTGTAEDYRDGLTIGYTPDLAIGVWVGNNDNSPMDRVAGSLGAAPIWRSLIEEFNKNKPIKQFVPPSGVTSRSVCTYSGLLVRGSGGGSVTEYFLAGSEPVRYCSTPRPTLPPTAVSNQVQTVISPIPEKDEDEANDGKNKENKKEKPGRGGPDRETFEETQQGVERRIEEIKQQFQQTQVSPPITP